MTSETRGFLFVSFAIVLLLSLMSFALDPIQKFTGLNGSHSWVGPSCFVWIEQLLPCPLYWLDRLAVTLPQTSTFFVAQTSYTSP